MTIDSEQQRFVVCGILNRVFLFQLCEIWYYCTTLITCTVTSAVHARF